MILFSLNPIPWIKEALVSDYVGSLIRHGLTALGTFLVLKGLANEQFAELLKSPEFVSGIVSIASSLVASVVNKKV